MRRLLIALFGCVVLAGCQTTQSVSELSEDAKLGRKIALEKCHTKHLRGGVEKNTTKWTGRDIIAYGADPKGQGWTMVDVAVEGRRTHVFFNRQTCKFMCGYDNWTRYKNRLTELRYHFPSYDCKAEERAKWPFKEGDSSKISVNWHSVGEEIQGRIDVENGARSGYIEFPDTTTGYNCWGRFNLKERNRGTWRAQCGTTVTYAFMKGEVTANTMIKELTLLGKDRKGNNVIIVAQF